MTVLDRLNSLIPNKDKEAFYSGLSNDALKAIRDNDPNYVKHLPSVASDYLHRQAIAPSLTQTTLQKLGSDHPVFGHIAADLATSGQNIANLLGKPLGIQNKSDYYAQYGVPRSTTDEIASQAIPFLLTAPAGEMASGEALATKLGQSLNLGKEAAEGGKLLSGGAVGGMAADPSKDNLAESALAGATGSGVGSMVGSGLAIGAKKAASPVLSWVGKLAQGDISRKMMKPLVKDIRNTQGYGETVKNLYDEAMDKFLSRHNDANGIASQLDELYEKNGVKLNPKDYINKLNDYVEGINKKTPVQQMPFQTAKEFAQNQLESGQVPSNFTDAIQLHKNLNQGLADFINKNDKLPGDVNAAKLVSDLKSTIRNNILKPNEKVPQIGALKAALEDANSHYVDAQNAAMVPNSLKTLVKNKNLLGTLKAGNTPPEKTGLKFIDENPQGFEQISKVMKTSPTTMAKKLIANKVLDENGNINISELLNRYKKLTPNQRDEIFTPKDKARIAALEATKADTQKIGGDIYKKIQVLGLPLLGAGVGLDEGHDWKSTLGGAALGFGASKFISHILANPKVLRFLMEDTKKPVASFKKSARVGGIGLGASQSNG